MQRHAHGVDELQVVHLDLAGLGADRDRHHRDRDAHARPRCHGKIFALALRPSPNAVRRPCTNSDQHRVAAAQPRAGVALVADVVDDTARRRGHLAAAGIGGLRAVGEQFGDPVPALVQAVQRQVQVGDRAQDLVVRARRRPAAPAASGRPASTGRPEPVQRGRPARRCPRPPRPPARRGAVVIAEIRSARSSRPPSMAISESQIRSTSPSRCEQTTTEMPNSVPIRWISASIASRPAGSSPLVGSSSSSRSGSCTSAWASLTRCFMPVE